MIENTSVIRGAERLNSRLSVSSPGTVGWLSLLCDRLPNLQAPEVDSDRWRAAQEFEAREWSLPNTVENEWGGIYGRYKPVDEIIRDRGLLDGAHRLLDVGSGPTCPGTLFEVPITIAVDPLFSSAFEPRTPQLLAGHAVAIAEQLPFKDASFDFIVAINCLDHGTSPTRAIAQCVRVLRPGGLLLVGQWIYVAPVALVKQLAERTGLWRNVGHPHSYSAGQFDRLIRAHGKVIDCGIVQVAVHANDFNKVDGRHAGRGPLLIRAASILNRLILRNSWFAAEAYWLVSKGS